MAERADDARATVYIVDGDPAVRESLASLLELRSYETAGFESAEALLRGGELESPACLVAEVALPGMDGVELLRILRHRGLRLPVIMIAASGDVRTAVRALQAGAVDFLEKPFVDRVLLRRIRQALDAAGPNGHRE